MEKETNTEEKEKFSSLQAIEEASRCLLCYEAPCSKACPAKTDPGRFIRALRFRNIKGAAEVIRENNSLGGICALICPTEKLCQKGCSRCGIDRPIEIGKLQQYITDYETKTGMSVLKVRYHNAGKIAVVGSGPSGLEAASILAIHGYEVTVFEKKEKLGGYLRYGIPSGRLPDNIIGDEIKKMRDLPITFKTNMTIGKDLPFSSLLTDYDAVLLATGFDSGNNLPMFADKKDVMVAVDYLSKSRNEGYKVDKDDVCLVIGGGDVGMDVCTTLKRQGVKEVIDVAREPMDEFLASPKELKRARDLNISLYDGYTPISYQDKTVSFRHVRLNSEMNIKADRVFMAVGQRSALKFDGLKTDDKGRLVLEGHRTSDPKVFVSGYLTSKDKIAVFAVKEGREAALEIISFLGGK